MPLGAREGTKIKVERPAAAAFPARELAAFPVEEQAIVVMPASTALVTAMAEALSFRDAVGFWPSSLIHKSRIPSCAPSASALYRGEPPTRRRGNFMVPSTGRNSL